MEMSDTTMITMVVTKVVVATGMSRMMNIPVRMFLLHHRFFPDARRNTQRSAAQI